MLMYVFFGADQDPRGSKYQQSVYETISADSRGQKQPTQSC